MKASSIVEVLGDSFYVEKKQNRNQKFLIHCVSQCDCCLVILWTTSRTALSRDDGSPFGKNKSHMRQPAVNKLPVF